MLVLGLTLFVFLWPKFAKPSKVDWLVDSLRLTDFLLFRHFLYVHAHLLRVNKQPKAILPLAIKGAIYTQLSGMLEDYSLLFLFGLVKWF